MKPLITFALALFIVGCASNDGTEITASGTIETTEVTVSARVGGEIVTLFVDEGSHVAKGDTLALVDRTDILIQLKLAHANAAATEAQYKLILRGFRSEDILQAEATFRNAQTDLQRAEELFKAQTVTQKNLDDTRTRFIVAQQGYEKMKRGSRTEDIAAARARRDVSLAQVEAAQKTVADAFVVAPMTGVITQKAIEQGDVVLPNGSLFRISRLDRVRLMIYVSVVELADVTLGQEADVFIDAYPEKPFTGRIIFISDKAEFTPKNVQTKDDRTKLVFGVKIEVPNPDQMLKPGMPADARIPITRKH